MNESYIFISSPYSHADPLIRNQRYEDVLKYSAGLMKNGLFIYSPIAHCHDMAIKYELPTDFSYWEKLDYMMIDHSAAVDVLMLDGWQASKGVKGEVIYARSIGKIVRFSYFDGQQAVSNHFPDWATYQ